MQYPAAAGSVWKDAGNAESAEKPVSEQTQGKQAVSGSEAWSIISLSPNKGWCGIKH